MCCFWPTVRQFEYRACTVWRIVERLPDFWSPRGNNWIFKLIIIEIAVILMISFHFLIIFEQNYNRNFFQNCEKTVQSWTRNSVIPMRRQEIRQTLYYPPNGKCPIQNNVTLYKVYSHFSVVMSACGEEVTEYWVHFVTIWWFYLLKWDYQWIFCDFDEVPPLGNFWNWDFCTEWLDTSSRIFL